MGAADCLLDISFVIDYSGSIKDTSAPGTNNWDYVIDFMVNLVRSINIGQRATHVGAVSFGMPLKLTLLPFTALYYPCSEGGIVFSSLFVCLYVCLSVNNNIHCRSVVAVL